MYELMTGDPPGVPASYRVLGVRVDAVQICDVILCMERWIEERAEGNYIAVTGMHGVMEAQQNQEFKSILEGASLVVPDGMPLVWLGRWYRFGLRRRVYGPELMNTFCRATGPRYRHFFYGGAPSVAERLAEVLSRKYHIRIAGTYCPPFRSLNGQEEESLISAVRSAAPDVLWVGLSTPKQETWMASYRDRLHVPVLIGVGAAFDFVIGRTQQAPPWMREHGLEWFFRLVSEPRRLWRRYLVYGSKFVWKVGLELSGIRRVS